MYSVAISCCDLERGAFDSPCDKPAAASGDREGRGGREDTGVLSAMEKRREIRAIVQGLVREAFTWS